jgi:hypothetical protein
VMPIAQRRQASVAAPPVGVDEADRVHWSTRCRAGSPCRRATSRR